MNETLIEKEKKPEAIVAKSLVERLLNQPQQHRLFEDVTIEELIEEETRSRLEKAYPGRLILKASLVDEYRYIASMYGAGFHPTQFDEVTYEVIPAGWTTVYLGYGFGFRWGYLDEHRKRRHNRMQDEVNEELFTTHVPTTSYESSMYATSPEDLQEIFEFDYINLAVCRRLDYDLLYERED